ncbi:MAG: hypothetical protein QW091_00290 [Candidatus Micrarchaeaceae archaeon]
MVEEEQEPKVYEIEFPGTVSSSIDSIRTKLSQVPFYAINQNADELDVVHVESRNIRKEPFLFYAVKIKKDSLVLTYSIVPNTSETLRRATVIKNLTGMLAIIADDFKIDENKFFQYIDSSIAELLGGLNESYSSLFNKYDALLSEYAELRKLASELTVSNHNLTVQAAQLSEENKTLQAQLNALQTYSDEAIMAMVQDWLEVHDSTIDIGEFSKTYKIPEPRIEQILDKMVSLGYLELKG